MSNARKIAVLEDLLGRVQRNAGAPRTRPAEAAHKAEPTTGRRPALKDPAPPPPAVVAPPAPPAPPAPRPPAAAAREEEPARPALDLSAPRAPMGTLAGIGPEVHRDEPPPPSAAALASSRPPPSVVLVEDDAPVAVEAGGEDDAAELGDGDELEELDEADVVSAGVESGNQDELIPVESEPPPRPRTVPPPLPVAEKKKSVPPPLPVQEPLEAEVPMPPPRAPMPTTEQLGNTLELEEGPEARLELAAAPAPKVEAPSEHEAELPIAQSPGQYKVDSLPAPDAPSREILDEHAPPREELAEVALGAVVLDPPPSPQAIPTVVGAPAPVVPVALSPAVIAAPRREAKVHGIVAAARRPVPTTWGELVDASMKLG